MKMSVNTEKDVIQPRNYQLRLVEYLSERNGIVYLPTGAGKTVVAVLALKRFSHNFNRSVEDGGQRALFICNTVALAEQNLLVLRNLTNFKVGLYVGKMSVEDWKREKWDQEIHHHQVLVGTGQVFLDMVAQNYLKLTALSIVIFDECHHGTGKHPYHEFMKLMEMQLRSGTKPLPRIVGLTGVLIKGNEITEIDKKLKALEKTYIGNIITVAETKELENVMLHSSKPRETMLLYIWNPVKFHKVEQIRCRIKSFFDMLGTVDIGQQRVRYSKSFNAERDSNKKSAIKLMMNDLLFQIDTYGIYAGSIAILSLILDFEMKRRQAETLILRNLYRAAITLCENIRHLLVSKLRDMLDDDDLPDDALNTEEVIMNFSVPRVQVFLQYLKQTFSNKNHKDICCLVFVERRLTCKCIYGLVRNYIKAVPELENVLTPQFMVGNTGRSYICENTHENLCNKAAIQEFRDGTSNIMICSNVLEEGIDIQSCNNVICLDPIKTFNMYIQTKGRARSKNSTYTLISSDTKRDKTQMQISEYRKAHENIRKFLERRVLEQCDPLLYEVKEHFEDLIPPFVNKSGAVLIASQALKVVHRYCQQLPSDAFGSLLPWFNLVQPKESEKHLVDLKRKMIVALTLPLNTNLPEPIYSDPMDSGYWAKISAAFKACIKLYEIGELNERFLPVSSKECISEIANVHFEHWTKYGDNVRETRKNRDKIDSASKTYEAIYPNELNDAMPEVGTVCYAYTIYMEPRFERDDYTSHVYDSMKTGRNYALLLLKRLPRLAKMPLFSHQGETHIIVAEKPLEMVIETQEQLELLKRFHVMIFRDLLRIWQPFYMFNNYSGENSYLVVPLSVPPVIGIDWALVRQFQRLPQVRATSVAERQQMQPMKPEDYEGKIVTQWYASYDVKRMIVTKVRTDLTATSKMEDKHQDNTYYEFTFSKYSQSIGDVVHKQQFLIEVRELTDQLNFYIQKQIKTSAQKRTRSKIILIPELCFNYGFPGDLWLKLTFLPSILRRLHYMLHAEYIRVEFNKFLGLDKLPINGDNYIPRPLIVDCSLRRNVDHQGNAIHDDDYDEPRPQLQPLATKGFEVAMDKMKISDLEVPWQKYMEPINIERQIMSVFPVEVAYLYGFINRNFENCHNMEINWDQDQFKMSEGNVYAKPKNTPEVPALMSSSGDVSYDKRMKTEVTLSVLQRSISNDHITAAEQGEYLAAITTAGSVDVFDMERFELLGDSFLKMSATLYLANKYSKWNEGILTQVKSTLVSNRNLLYCLCDTGLPSRICSTLFTPKYTWLPPCIALPKNVRKLWTTDPNTAALVRPHNLHNLCIKEEELFSNGDCGNEAYNSFVESLKANQNSELAHIDISSEINFCVGKNKIVNKVIADTLEALLGVVVKNYGLHHGFRMLEWFGILKSEIDQPLSKLLAPKLGGTRMRTNISQSEVDQFLINYQYLERNLGYTFRDRAYLLQALTHPSYPTNRLTGCYQELEFVGDAILDFLISAYIFEHNVGMTPGLLTDLRSALVNNSTLACICVRHRFHSFILAENTMLSECIQNFVHFQESHNHRVTNHVRILMEESDVHRRWRSEEELELIDEANKQATKTENPNSVIKGDYNISQNVDVPKALGDVLEAIIAAIYLDSRDLNTTWQVVYKLFEPELIEFSRSIPLNPIRQLNEHKQAHATFSSVVNEGDVAMVTCEFICMEKSMKVYGFGNNGKQAKRSAAKHALQMLAKCEA